MCRRLRTPRIALPLARLHAGRRAHTLKSHGSRPRRMKSAESEWVSLLAEVFERLSAANATITYDFDNVTFEADRVEAGGKALPSGKVRINGKITITSG